MLADQSAVGDALAAALSIRGLAAMADDCAEHLGPADGPLAPGRPGRLAPPTTGVVSCTVDDGLSLASVQAFLCSSPGCWVVVTDPPVDARWGALLVAGAAEVVGTGRDLDELVSVLRRVDGGALEAPGSREDTARAAFLCWADLHPPEEATLAALSRIDRRELSRLRRLLRTGADAGGAEEGCTAAVLHELGVADDLAAVAAVRALDTALLER
ncbi:hypothetical protein [Nocardioides abyssi]|uniref:Uncharacterized protein n=1 Tax=Nocardioides abyssi TaxID=3058370 RepID=A0ABT8EUB7_9ACTN|nr:hypothetical protein [Nocardioides abyssi]MDN4161720.1 hypothetical protein [Nocardioides abyssi]